MPVWHSSRYWYRDYHVTVHRQVLIPPHLEYVAYAQRDEGGIVLMFNVEGHTAQEAMANIQRSIDARY
jgi:hypothetical protein